jgi:predicted small metal-binding protein
MRVVECNICGELVSASDDGELVAVVRHHMDAQHGDLDVGDDRVRELVEQGAYDATDA